MTEKSANQLPFSNLFAQAEPRETSGASSSNRFTYQQNYAFCKLLEIHTKLNDYLLTLDYHEDLVLFESSRDPEYADFIQVKTSKAVKGWSVKALTKTRTKNEPASTHSYVGKLLQHRSTFGDYAKKLIFTSNVQINSKLSPGDRNTIDIASVDFNELSDEEKEKFYAELDLKKGEKESLEKVNFTKTNLGLDDQEAYVTGKIVEFCKSVYGHETPNASLIYNTIANEFKKRNNSEAEFKDFETIVKEKSVSRPQFESMISKGLHHKNMSNRWSEVRSVLRSAGYNHGEIQTIQQYWRDFTIHKMDATNELVNGLYDSILAHKDRYERENTSYSLQEEISAIKHSLKKDQTRHLNENYMEAAILAAICE